MTGVGKGMRNMEKKKQRVPMSVKLNALTLVIILTLSVVLIVIAYNVNSRQVDTYYKEMTANNARTVASFLDGDWIDRFVDTIYSEEYQQLRKTAIEAKDEEMIRQYLVQNNWYTGFEAVRDVLRQYRDKLGVAYVYTVTLEGEDSFTIIDPDEDLFYIGTFTPVPPEFHDLKQGQAIEPTVSVTEYGWLCSAYDIIQTSDGGYAALVGVDIDMTRVMAERKEFLTRMIISSGGLLIISIFASFLLMHKVVIDPLTMLSDATSSFTEHNHGFKKEDIISLPITANDEIGDLYQVIRTMQGKIVEYLDNLTHITAEKERISAELSIATQIQADMLPRIFPPFPSRHDFDIYATMTPAKEVGGDFYDFFLIDDDHLGLVMADVSGKGVPAALFMVIAKTLIKNRAMMGGGPAEILRHVNEQLCEGNEAELFVTVWLAIVELSTGKGMAANAGHEHPAIRHANGEYELVVYRHSPAVALMEDMRFKEHSFELRPGDSLFVYTDGVTEATNKDNELFGTDRMIEALNRNPDASPAELLPEVKAAIDSFVGEAPQFDDITMMCVQYNGAEVKT